MNSIAEFLQDVGVLVTKSYSTANGNEIVAYCPWHDDSTASLAINTENGWHCFAGCGKGRTLESLLVKFAPNKTLYQELSVSSWRLLLSHLLYTLGSAYSKPTS